MSQPASREPIKIIIVDDHPLVRSGIRAALASSPTVHLVEGGEAVLDDSSGRLGDAFPLRIRIVGEGGSGEEFHDLVQVHHPDIVLLDLNMPQRAGETTRTGELFQPRAAIAWAHQNYPQTHILIISQHLAPALVEGFMNEGVRGYILKDEDLNRLPTAIQILVQGGMYLSEAVTRALHSHSSRPPVKLTGRQLDILWSIFRHPDFDAAEHAQALGISINTYKGHLRDVKQILNTETPAGLLMESVKQGIIDVAFFSVLPD